MKPESQIAILKTIVKWQAQEIEALQWRVKALERGPEWQRIGHTGFSWDWQCRDCQATMFAGHTLDCIHSEYVRPDWWGCPDCQTMLRDGHTSDCIHNEKGRELTGSIQGTNGTVTMTIPPQWEDTDEPKTAT